MSKEKKIILSETSEKILEKLPNFGIRHLQSFLAFLGVSIAYALRANLSVAIVAMTDKTETVYDTFDWDQSKKSLILSSFYWGYLVNQVPGGLISKRYGAKYTLIFSLLSSSILTLLIPIITKLVDWQGLLALRFLIGIVQGVTFPSVHTFLSKWAPYQELGRLSAFVYSGAILGTFVMMSSSGIIAKNFGWQTIFYGSGSIGIIWTIFWQVFGSSTPAQHSSISELERSYILESLGHSKDSHKEYIPTPWKKIFTSVPFYALLAPQCSHLFGFTILLTESPIYFNGVFNVPIDSNALIASLPYLAGFIMNYVFILIDYMISKRQLLTVNQSRKIFNGIGQFSPAIGLLILGFIPKGYLELGVTVLILSKSLNSACGLGAALNHIDLAPNHAGTLMGICSFFSGIFSILAPLVVGWIVVDVHNQQQWQIVFIMVSSFLIIGASSFLFFGSTSIQDWNDLRKDDKKDEKKIEKV